MIESIQLRQFEWILMKVHDWLRGTPHHTLNHQPPGQHTFPFGHSSFGRPVAKRPVMQMTAVYSCVRILA